MDALELATVRNMAERILEVSGGRFLASNSPAERRRLAKFFGSPIFAIRALAPEILETNPVTVLVGEADGLDADGGRWLSLHARTLGAQNKLDFTLCVKARSKIARKAGKILIQPHQLCVVGSWTQRLENLERPPSAIICTAQSLPSLDQALINVCAHAAGQKLLISCTCHPEAVVVQELLRLRGYQPSKVINFALASNKPNWIGTRAWWVAGQIPAVSEDADPETLSRISRVWEFVQLKVARALDLRNPDAQAAFFEHFCNPVSCKSEDGVAFDGLIIEDVLGINLETASIFVARGTENGVLTTERADLELPKDLRTLGTALLRDSKDDHARFRRILWVEEFREFVGKQTDTHSETEQEERRHDASPGLDSITQHRQLEPESQSDDYLEQPSETQHQPEPTPAELLPRLRKGAGKVDVLAVAGQLGKPGVRAGTFDLARSLFRDWLQEKGFPVDSHDRAQSEVPQGELATETNGDVWAIRLDDRRSMDQRAIWRVEATLVRTPPTLGLRLSQVRQSPDAPSPADSGVPSVVARLVDAVGLSDAGVPFAGSSQFLTGDEGARKLLGILTESARAHPIVVWAGCKGCALEKSLHLLARRLVGVALVVGIDESAAAHLEKAVGDLLGLPGKAIRVYASGFHIGAESHHHPWWRLDESSLGPKVAAEVFEAACALSLRCGDLEERVPTFHYTRQKLADIRMHTLSEEISSKALSVKERLSKAEKLNEELRKVVSNLREESAEHRKQLRELTDELQLVKGERDVARDGERRLRRQLTEQWITADPIPEELDDEPDYPNSWDELELWVEAYGQGRLVLHNKAIKAARESPFRDIPLAYKALDFLARFYVPMRTRPPNDNEPYERANAFLALHGLEDSDVGTADDIHRYKRAYQRSYEGDTVTLNRHVKRHGGFDPAVVFRLYYYYDSDRQKVLVGHLPTHLVNRLSHNG